MVYFHLPMLYHLFRFSSISVLYSSFKPAFNISDGFQYCLPILNSGILFTVSLIRAFNFPNLVLLILLVLYKLTFKFSILILPVALFLILKPFHSFCLRIFLLSFIGQHSRHIIFQYFSIYYSRIHSIFRLPFFLFMESVSIFLSLLERYCFTQKPFFSMFFGIFRCWVENSFYSKKWFCFALVAL